MKRGAAGAPRTGRHLKAAEAVFQGASELCRQRGAAGASRTGRHLEAAEAAFQGASELG